MTVLLAMLYFYGPVLLCLAIYVLQLIRHR